MKHLTVVKMEEMIQILHLTPIKKQKVAMATQTGRENLKSWMEKVVVYQTVKHHRTVA